MASTCATTFVQHVLLEVAAHRRVHPLAAAVAHGTPSGMTTIMGAAPMRPNTGSRTSSIGGAHRRPSVGGCTSSSAFSPKAWSRYAARIAELRVLVARRQVHEQISLARDPATGCPQGWALSIQRVNDHLRLPGRFVTRTARHDGRNRSSVLPDSSQAWNATRDWRLERGASWPGVLDFPPTAPPESSGLKSALDLVLPMAHSARLSAPGPTHQDLAERWLENWRGPEYSKPTRVSGDASRRQE